MDVIANNTNLSQVEIQNLLSKWSAQFDQMKQSMLQKTYEGISATTYNISQNMFYLFLINIFSLQTSIAGSLLIVKRKLSGSMNNSVGLCHSPPPFPRKRDV